MAEEEKDGGQRQLIAILRELADAAQSDLENNRDETPGGWWSLRTEKAIAAARAALRAAE